MAQSAGDLAKSASRWSLAMSLLAANQAKSLMSSAERPAAPLDEVTKAMSDQLTGTMKTAYAVGTNVQAGLVDAAFNLSGMGVHGQAPSGDTSALAIPLATGALRRVAGVRTVASGALNRQVPQEELVQRLSDYHKEAAGEAAALDRTSIGLWKSEGLSTTLGKYSLPENKLSDPRLPRQALPIAHVGFGSGSTEALEFDVAKLNALFAERCAVDFRPFSYEGIGAILRIYERGFFKVMSGTLGLIRLDAPDGPDPTGFFAKYLDEFPPDIQRLITHGYGRIVAFSNMNIYRAIEEVTSYPAERIEPAVHGTGFAFAIMNSADLPKLLRNSAIPYDRTVRAAFQNGLIYSLVFYEWYAPGLLAAWKPEAGLEAELIEHARNEAALTVQRGYPLAFRLQNPRS
jgi:hypothetical protein